MSNKDYFNKAVHDAIIRYCIESDENEKQKLYIEYIDPTFKQLIEKVVYAYKFTGLKNLEDLKDDCLSMLISNLQKFNPDYGSKAFSYFTVITKNWFICKYKEQQKQKQFMIKNKNFAKDNESYDMEESFFKKEFYDSLIKDIKTWDLQTPKSQIVTEALIKILTDVDKFDFINKKMTFFSIKEITNLKTSELSYLMKKVVKRYNEFRKKWESENRII
jgi:hypothetical protein